MSGLKRAKHRSRINDAACPQRPLLTTAMSICILTEDLVSLFGECKHKISKRVEKSVNWSYKEIVGKFAVDQILWGFLPANQGT